MTRARQSLLAGIENVYDSAPRKLTHAVRGKICEGFIQQYMNAACDRDPTGLVYRMPMGISKIDLHALYKVVHKDGLEKSEFYNILDTKFKSLVFSKSQRFTKCTACHNFRCLIEKEKDPEAKSALIAKRNLHLEEQQLEREAYYVRRAQAEMRPNAILSVILDGMDQNKSDLPHYALWNAPSGSGQMKLKTHIMGSIVHGRGKYFFVDHREIPHDTNLSLSCLLKILAQESQDGTLPATLYVQLDNTTRENKNKYFLGMMAYLVKKGYLEEVYISFLFVGHTHEDVDQSFSKISQRLKTTDALTSDELLTVIRQSHTPEPTVREIGTVWDIKAWLESSINQVHNVTFPQIYRIFKDETGHSTIKYKTSSAEEIWHPQPNEAALEIFKMDESGEQKVPVGIPDPVNPVMDEGYMKELKRSMQKDFKLAQFTIERKEWWENLFDCPVKQTEEAWPIFNQTQRLPSRSSLTSEELAVVQKYLDRRQHFKEVCTKTQQDRRIYKAGAFLLFKDEERQVHVGKVISSSESKDKVDIIVYIDRTNRLIPTDIRKTVDVSLCVPGSFCLTPAGNLPATIRQKMQSI